MGLRTSVPFNDIGVFAILALEVCIEGESNAILEHHHQPTARFKGN